MKVAPEALGLLAGRAGPWIRMIFADRLAVDDHVAAVGQLGVDRRHP
jgi:hypothetical protein